MEMTSKVAPVSSKNGAFARLSIQNKLFAGFGVVVALTAGLAVYGFWGSYQAANGFADYRSTARQSNAFSDMKSALLTGRLAVMKYRVADFESAAGEVRTEMARIAERTANLREFAASEADEAVFSGLEAQAQTYAAGFAEATQLQTRRHTLVNEEMTPLGTEVRKDFSEIMRTAYRDNDPHAAYYAGLAQKHLMLARYYAKDFLLSNQDAARERTIEEIGAARSQTQVLLRELQNPTRRQIANGIMEKLDLYESLFQQVAQIITERNAIYANTLDSIGPDMLAQMVTATDAMVAQQDRIGPEISAQFVGQKWMTAIVGLVSLLAGMAMAFFVGRSLSVPIVSMTSAMRRLADEDLETVVPARERGDEIGDMAGAVQVFKDNMIEARRLRAEQSEEQTARERRQAAIEHAISEFQESASSAIENVGGAVGQLESLATSLTATAEETSMQSASVSSSSEEASTNVQTVAASAEELAASIQEISRQVSQSNDMSKQAVTSADHASKQVQGLADAANKIGDVVSMISDIAEQTNLLALNATIEAARAGEAGKGFAVVASEVKTLAEQTGKATSEIGDQIGTMQSATHRAVEAIRDITGLISCMDEISTMIAAAVEEQGSATGEIAANVQQAAAGAQEVSHNIAGVSQAAEETGQASGGVLAASNELGSQAAGLRQQIDTFLGAIRAA
ncbi:MAG: methyl-accepting chemotaxis protein [Pseudomonadota bacterium]